MFPATAHYVALGHLHRQQEIAGPCPTFYSGSPLAIDFGEEANEPAALIVTVGPGIRADARGVPISGGRRLRTIRGTLDQVIAEGEQAGDAYLRVVLAEPSRAGLGDLVRDAHRERRGDAKGKDRPSRAGRGPLDLFGDYLAEQNIDDPRIASLFAELLDEVTGAAQAAEFADELVPAGTATQRGAPGGRPCGSAQREA
jgi:exonuclease SbcD